MWQVKEGECKSLRPIYYWIPLLPTDEVVMRDSWKVVVLGKTVVNTTSTLIAIDGRKVDRLSSYEREHTAQVCTNPYEEMEGLGFRFIVMSPSDVELLANYLAPSREPNFWLRYGKYLEEVPCSN